ncbi:MAG: YfcE family phosphodiesterase [Clostridia bacterium]|nr:YfcE family phosphodiesterase [Clostridia bacterium]
MKALIMSDSHKAFSAVCSVIDANPDINMIIHAGDVHRDVEDIMDAYPMIPCAYVLGNNDFSVWDVPYDRFFEWGGKKIFLTHGHNYGVKLSPARVVKEAKKLGADICIFGHTHTKYFDDNDIIVINPGSVLRSYAILTIENGKAMVEFKER